MFAVAFDLDRPFRIQKPADYTSRRIADIAELRNQVVVSRDLLYCSPPIRTLIEDEIPALLALAKGCT